MNDSPSNHARIAVAQIGARRHYAIPTILHRAGMLERLYTDLSADAWWLRTADLLLPGKCKPASLKRLLARRIEGVPAHRVTQFGFFALQRVLQRDQTSNAAQLFEQTVQANRRFCELVSRHGFGDANAVYVFNGAGLELLEAATRNGMTRIVEQTAAPLAWDERLLAEERQLFPDWEQGDIREQDWQPLAEREVEEWKLADMILCGSEHVARTLAEEGGPAERCVVVPYGVDTSMFSGEPRSPHKRPLRVLSVGNVQLRKGTQYLMQTARALRCDDIEIRVVGQIMVSELAERQLRENLELTGPIPRNLMQQQYAWADVMVLPSLSEGSANVCYEALACGVPVITTENAGSVVRGGVEGLIIPIRSSDAITEAIQRLNFDRDLLSRMSCAAIKRAKEYSWEQYARRLVTAVQRAFERDFAHVH